MIRRAAELLGLPAILVLAWWWASASGHSYYVPAPPAIVAKFGGVWLGPRLAGDVLPSVLRLFAGYGLAALLGVALGIAIGQSSRLRSFCEPTLELFRAIPPPVLVPLVMVIAGIGNTMKVLVIVSGCIWPILLNTVEGVRGTDEVLSDSCRVYGIRGAARLRNLVLRGASPRIMTGLRQALSIAIILMVISEMFASSSGLGFTIVSFQRSFAIPEMWSGILLLGILGFALAGSFRAIERRVLAWYFGLRRAERGSMR